MNIGMRWNGTARDRRSSRHHRRARTVPAPNPEDVHALRDGSILRVLAVENGHVFVARDEQRNGRWHSTGSYTTAAFNKLVVGGWLLRQGKAQRDLHDRPPQRH